LLLALDFGLSEIILDLHPKSPAYGVRLVPRRGAYRDRHGTLERDAVDAMASSRALSARTNDAYAYGEVVWS
jgi:hypothetical protein